MFGHSGGFQCFMITNNTATNNNKYNNNKINNTALLI